MDATYAPTGDERMEVEILDSSFGNKILSRGIHNQHFNSMKFLCDCILNEGSANATETQAADTIPVISLGLATNQQHRPRPRPHAACCPCLQ